MCHDYGKYRGSDAGNVILGAQLRVHTQYIGAAARSGAGVKNLNLINLCSCSRTTPILVRKDEEQTDDSCGAMVYLGDTVV